MKSMLGTWLEDTRTAKGMTKGQMSETIGIVVGQYSAYVNGKSIPRKATLDKISRAFAVSEDDLRKMLDTPAPADTAPADVMPEYDSPVQEAEAPVNAGVTNIQAQLAAAQSKVLEGKIDLVIAMLTDISNRLPR